MKNKKREMRLYTKFIVTMFEVYIWRLFEEKCKPSRNEPN